MASSHATSFATTKFRKYGTDLYVVYSLRIEIWICGESGFEHCCEEFVVVGIFEATLLRPCDGCAESGEKDDIVGLFGQDVFRPFLNEACHFTLHCALFLGSGEGGIWRNGVEWRRSERMVRDREKGDNTEPMWELEIVYVH